MKRQMAPSVAAYVAVAVAVLRTAPLDRKLRARPPLLIGGPTVSVIIPARDEADKLGLLLADIGRAAAGGAVVEVIVVDDGSSDGTAALAASSGSDVVPAGDRPAGWNPKVWALTQGAARATNDVLVFLDADVRLASGSLDALIADHSQVGGLLSVAPTHLAVGPFEAMAAGCDTLAVVGGGPGLRPSRHAAGAVGSCLVISRADYHRIGGHAAMPATIVDDIDLARVARRTGLAVSLRRGGSLISVRSHPEGLGGVVDGFTKNLAAGMSRTPAPSAVAIGAWIAALVWPLALAARRRWAAAALAWVAASLHMTWVTRRVGRYHLVVTSAGAPVLGLFLTAVTIRSILARGAGRVVTWKGRQLDRCGLEVTPRC